MKRCPECRRDYYDDTLLYCLDDGSALLKGPAIAVEPATLIRGRESVSLVTDRESGPDEGFAVAVSSFRCQETDPDLAALADGLAEETLIALLRFPYLRVLSRSAVPNAGAERATAGKTAAEMGARYYLNGTLRRAGTSLRVAVHLTDTATGATLWSDTYNRIFDRAMLFELQDDLVPRIVSTVADHFGVLARSISDAVRRKDKGNLTPYEALMRAFGYHYRLTREEHAEAREILRNAVQQAPNNADCWAMLAWIYAHEYAHAFDRQEDSLDRALAAALRAADLAPTNSLVQQTLAVAYFFRRDLERACAAAERALELNPYDASNEAIFVLTFAGAWDRGCGLLRHFMELNPYHPAWYRLVLALNEYRLGNYEEALAETVGSNVSLGLWTNLLLTAAYGQLNQSGLAREALAELNKFHEQSGVGVREMITRWFLPDMANHLNEGLEKARSPANLIVPHI